MIAYIIYYRKKNNTVHSFLYIKIETNIIFILSSHKRKDGHVKHARYC